MSARRKQSAKSGKKKHGTDINRYLGVEFPEDKIDLPALQARPDLQRNESSSSLIRNSMTKMFSTAPSVSDMANRHSRSVRRWRNKSTTSATTTSTPLRDPTNTTNRTASPKNTHILPELPSSPPMPTFQKSTRSNSPRTEFTLPRTSLRRPGTDTLPVPPIADPGRLLGNMGTRVGPALVERVEETPPLPAGWTQQHDRAICVLDARGYSLAAIVVKVRRTFFGGEGGGGGGMRGLLTEGMVDKRLRQLDQDVEIDYWRAGLLGEGKKSFIGPQAGGRLDSGNTSSSGGGGGGGGENAPPRVQEPTLKTTVSGSLLKSQSTANLLPDTVSMSTEPPTPMPVTPGFHPTYRTPIL